MTRKNSSRATVPANALGLTRITRDDSIRIGHSELLVTTSPSTRVFFLFFLSTSLVDCYLCFSGLSFDARRDDGVPFCHRFFPSPAFARFFFCPIAMYIFSVQSRPALMLPKALSSLSALLYPVSIERVLFKKCIIISIYI